MVDGTRVTLEYAAGHERLRLEAWGEDSIRVRASQAQIAEELPGALAATCPAPSADATGDRNTLVNGKLRAQISSDGLVSFWRSDDGRELLSEQKAHFWWPGPRLHLANGNGHYRIEQRFKAYDGEKLYGLGQHLHGEFNQKGLVMDLVQRNAEVSIPFMVSNRGYGFLWNSPAVGRVELANNGTRWVSDSARQIDYWVTAGDKPADLLSHYADATGHAPDLPSWASGFWQSKLRYRTQEELLGVAREYHRRGVPLAVIVSDFFHWEHLGDWSFDPSEWPDPVCNGERTQVYGHRANGVSLAMCQPAFGQLSADVGKWLLDRKRAESTSALDLAGTRHERLDRNFLLRLHQSRRPRLHLGAGAEELSQRGYPSLLARCLRT